MIILDNFNIFIFFYFSGLMYKKNFSIRRFPEVVAILHFFSDDAYNMSGFNISYKFNGCPTIDSGLSK